MVLEWRAVSSHRTPGKSSCRCSSTTDTPKTKTVTSLRASSSRFPIRSVTRSAENADMAKSVRARMGSPLDEFGKTAQRLSRNPLGIIALFIVLIYGIAGLVFGTASASLQPNERLPLVWFLVLFPCVVLVAFYLLVTRHHTKLCAPRLPGSRRILSSDDS